MGLKRKAEMYSARETLPAPIKKDSLILKQGNTIYATNSVGRAMKFIDYIFGTTVCEITAAINTKNLAKNLIRVRSSNVWAVGYNVKEGSNKIGDLVMQFKNPNGGGGDTYIYYDVPVQVYRKLVSAASVGHTFWVLVRENYNYSKLSGNRIGTLPNAINH